MLPWPMRWPPGSAGTWARPRALPPRAPATSSCAGKFTRVAALNLRAIEQQSQRTRRIATRTITTLGLLAALGILATFSFIFSFPDYLTKPVEELTAGIRRLGAGDYSQRLPTPVHHEFTEVTQAFDDMARKLDGYETAENTPRTDSNGPPRPRGPSPPPRPPTCRARSTARRRAAAGAATARPELPAAAHGGCLGGQLCPAERAGNVGAARPGRPKGVRNDGGGAIPSPVTFDHSRVKPNFCPNRPPWDYTPFLPCCW